MRRSLAGLSKAQAGGASQMDGEAPPVDFPLANYSGGE